MTSPPYRHVLGHFPTGVVAITAIDPQSGAPAGMTIGSFTSVSLDPPLVAFLPSKSSASFEQIRRAGSFCVNVLSAEQEWICRNFAIHGDDKYEGIQWTAGGSGSPILDGVVAWVDCDIEHVYEAGDHYIVLGHVRDLDISVGEHPLLFFQGGYGQFSSPWLVMPPEDGLEPLLRMVDFARTDMIKLADELNVECLASTAMDDELVIIASAGKPGRRLVGSVGQRVPFLPPVGMAIAAWASDFETAQWIRRVTATTDRVDELILEKKLNIVKRRGWALALASPAQMMLEAAVAQLDPRSPTSHQQAEVAAAVTQMVTADGYEPAEISPSEVYHVRHISAPVLAPDGSVAFALNIYGLRKDLTGAELIRNANHLVRRAEAISEKLVEVGVAGSVEQPAG